jgi:hypothetical protein
MVRDGLLCFVCPKRFSLSGSQAWIGASLDVDQFPSASLTTRQVFLWPGSPANRTEQPIAARSVFEGEAE